MAQVSHIHQKFAQHLSSTTFSSLNEVEGPTGIVFAASNRLFTPKQEAPTEQDNPFQYGLDPIGTIARRKTIDLLHAPANMVRYFKLYLGGESE
jgi:hypothetical protein